MDEITIDWKTLLSAFQTNVPDVFHFLSLTDGEVIRVSSGDEKLTSYEEEGQPYARVGMIPSRVQYQWVQEFVAGQPDGDLRTRMETAINGKGAFRRFKDLLFSTPEARKAWFDYRDQQMRVFIVEWVANRGAKAANTPPWTEDGTPIDEPSPVPEEAPTASSVEDDIQALRAVLSRWAKEHANGSLEDASLDELVRVLGSSFRFECLTVVAREGE